MRTRQMMTTGRVVFSKLWQGFLSLLFGFAIVLGGQAVAATPQVNLPAVAKVVTTTEVVAAKNLRPILTTESAMQMRSIADRYGDIVAQGGFPKVPRGSYKKGSTGKGVFALNQRLYVDGYVRVEATQGEFGSLFTSATEDGVRRFQRNMGLQITGKVDQTTLFHLNVPAQERLRTINANIERLEIYGKDLGDRYLIVNIPGQQIETVTNGKVFSRHNAIVGRPSRPSPVVITSLADINFNPYWNAPVSIVEADIMPKLRSGTKVLEDMNIRVFKGFGGPEVDPGTVNWSRAIPDDYHFRQEPGGGNAMATAKINFQSPFGIYLHDTPEKQLFDSQTRFYSSGCVRVQDMPGLVNWVLAGQDGIDEFQIATLAETLERKDVKLAVPPQLRVVYLTAWPVGKTVAFRHDIYDLDGSGFTVGQPMPVGEMSPDGQRYVLKPLPRLVASIEEGNNNGFFLFGGKRRSESQSFFGSTKKKGSDSAGGFFFQRKPASEDDDSAASSTKVTQKAKADQAARKTADKFKSKAKKGKDVPGVFDWAAWRKEQAAAAKSGKSKKKIAKKAKPDDKKIAKKSSGKDARKSVAAVDDKAKDVSKKKDAGSTKSATGKTADCTPGKDGKLPKGCKTAAVVKKPVATTKPKAETATN